MNFAFFKKRGFLFILALSVGFLGLLDVIGVDFLGSSRNSPFRAFSAKSEASSISAEKLNLLGLIDKGKNWDGHPLSLSYAWRSLALWIWYAFLR